jgi:5-methylcytosine-specific restriction protein B
VIELEPESESAMRADESKQRRFEELRGSEFYAAVVAANQAYLGASVPNAPSHECTRWALTCLPTSVDGRLSAISMKGMETFVLRLPHDEEQGNLVNGFVNLRPSLLAPDFEVDFPKLKLTRERKYRDAGSDQGQVSGHYDGLIAARGDPTFAAAARRLAVDLLESPTSYSRYHNYKLADAVLGRTR